MRRSVIELIREDRMFDEFNETTRLDASIIEKKTIDGATKYAVVWSVPHFTRYRTFTNRLVEYPNVNDKGMCYYYMGIDGNGFPILDRYTQFWTADRQRAEKLLEASKEIFVYPNIRNYEQYSS